MKLSSVTALTLCIAAVGCANAPKAIRTPIPSPTVHQIQAKSDAYVGQKVRWGGTIVRIDNQQEYTEFEIVSRSLSRSGRPMDTDKSFGRFIARSKQFFEPNDYKPGRELTIVGSIGTPVLKKIGEHDYTFPLVEVAELYLWQPLAEYPLRPYYWPYSDPWGYGYPFYGYHPFYGHHYPYRHHYRY